uniref:Uncharacterized protein n=1 Tax=Leersia perrieri TaxID=77586 RepID=A0A0D9WEU6_9ORYZ
MVKQYCAQASLLTSCKFGRLSNFHAHVGPLCQRPAEPGLGWAVASPAKMVAATMIGGAAAGEPNRENFCKGLVIFEVQARRSEVAGSSAAIAGRGGRWQPVKSSGLGTKLRRGFDRSSTYGAPGGLPSHRQAPARLLWLRRRRRGPAAAQGWRRHVGSPIGSISCSGKQHGS